MDDAKTCSHSYKSLTAHDVAELAQGLESNTEVQLLNLNWCGIGDYGALRLARALSKNTTLTVLHLAGNGMCDGDGISALMRVLRTNGRVTELDLNSNPIGQATCTYIMRKLAKISSLRTLHLNCLHNGFTAYESLHALSANQSLRKLQLASNNIDDNGAVAIAGVLAVNSALHVVNLGSNKITARGAAALANALKENVTLHTLLLYNNPLTDLGVIAITDMLNTNTSLHNVNLSCTKYTDVGLAAMNVVLALTCTACLDYRDNNLEPLELLALAGPIEKVHSRQLPVSGIFEAMKALDEEAKSALALYSVAPPYLCAVLHRQLDRQPLLVSAVVSIARTAAVYEAANITPAGSTALTRLRARLLTMCRYSEPKIAIEGWAKLPKELSMRRYELSAILSSYPFAVTQSSDAFVNVVYSDGKQQPVRLRAGLSVVLQDLAANSSPGTAAAKLPVSEEDATAVLTVRRPQKVDEATVARLLCVANYLHVPVALNYFTDLLTRLLFDGKA